MLNQEEFDAAVEAVEAYPELAGDLCDHVELAYEAYGRLYGEFPDLDTADSVSSEDADASALAHERIDRIACYVIEVLLRKDPDIVKRSTYAPRNLSRFVLDGDRYVFKRYMDEPLSAKVVVGEHEGEWYALEYGGDGKVTHRGAGSTAQDALYNMRIVI